MKLRTILLLAVPALVATGYVGVRASDHDDGENELKGRNLNLTDLYVFREDWQTGTSGDAANLVYVMNSNPRSLPQQQYYFSTIARYEFHISKAGTNNDTTGTTNDDFILRFTFGAPDTNDVQTFTMEVVQGGSSLGTGTGTTTTIKGAGTPTNNTISIGGQTFTVFAGLREDPFFFNVTGYFKFRAAAAGGANLATSAANFSNVDFTPGYNVNSIVVRVPLSFLQAGGDKVFDNWLTISIPKS